MDRRTFVRGAATAALAAAAGPLAGLATAEPPKPAPSGGLPSGRIAGFEFSRLMLGGNLITGYAHSRDLPYVNNLMKRYNTEAKILETLALAEQHGINAINLAIWDDLSFLKKHWKQGGKMKLIAQAMPQDGDLLAHFQKAVDFGAAAVHVNGHGAEKLVGAGEVELIGKTLAYLKSQKVPAGVCSHAMEVMRACVKAGLEPDFWQKTLHLHEYASAPKEGDTNELGRHDNSWCRDPQEVVDFMFNLKQPWIAFKVMAAGAIPPRRAFKHAFDSGADFILAGMFDWQIADDVKIAREAIAGAQRTRPWRG